MEKRLVILLHGFGSNGDDLAGLGAHWSAKLPHLSTASPNAPFHVEQGAGWQWFSLTGITAENRLQRVAQARDAFDTVLNTVLTQHNMHNKLDRVVLVGFSQGSMMALDALVSGRWPVAGVVAFSGRFASPGPYDTVKKRPILLIHGMADEVIPYSESETAAITLQELGIPVTHHLEPNTGHTISVEGAAHAAAFIARCLPV